MFDNATLYITAPAKSSRNRHCDICVVAFFRCGFNVMRAYERMFNTVSVHIDCKRSFKGCLLD